jgi:hypothetical protein
MPSPLPTPANEDLTRAVSAISAARSPHALINFVPEDKFKWAADARILLDLCMPNVGRCRDAPCRSLFFHVLHVHKAGGRPFFTLQSPHP